MHSLRCHIFAHFYRNDPKFLDKEVWANSADPDQGLHCLLFLMHLFDDIFYGLGFMFEF